MGGSSTQVVLDVTPTTLPTSTQVVPDVTPTRCETTEKRWNRARKTGKNSCRTSSISSSSDTEADLDTEFAQANLDSEFEVVSVATCVALISVLQEKVKALEDKIAELEKINHV